MKLKFLNLFLFSSLIFAENDQKRVAGLELLSSIDFGSSRAAKETFFNTVTPAFYEKQVNANDLDQSLTTMFTIDQSGRYYLANDITLTPGQSSSVAIKINANNVVLNLNSHFIIQNGGSASLKVIDIASNASNVIIFNGFINGIQGTAININSSCSNIFFNSLNIHNCNEYGILGASSNNLEFNNIVVSGCTGAGAGATDGAVGAKLTSCTNIILNSCFFNNNVGSGVESKGVILSGCKGVQASNTTANGNSGTVCYGFNLESSSVSNNFKNCSAKFNTSTSGLCAGFYVDSSNSNTFDNCSAISNIATGSHVQGIYIDTTNNSVIKNCRLESNSSNNNAYGLRLDTCKYTTVENSFGNYQTTSGTTTDSFGFYSYNGEGNSFASCLASGNVAGSDSTAKGVGIGLEGSEKYSSIKNCSCKANDGNAGNGYGIWSDDTVSYSYVSSNNLINNTGDNNGYGIKDDASSSVSTYFKNLAYGNGTNDGQAINNYDISPSPNDTPNAFPVVQLFLTDFSAYTSNDSFDNIELLENAN